MTLPAIDSIGTFNGAPNGTLVDYSTVEDPTTDVAASGMNALMADVAMMTGTITRAWANITYNGGGVILNSSYALWGNSNPVLPTLARTGTGVYTLAYPASISDALGISQSINLRDGSAQVKAGGYTAYVTVAVNVATVHVFNSTTGAAADPTNQAICVFLI